MPSDEQLKQALAKMLPNVVHMALHPDAEMWWMQDGHKMTKVLDTELLHLCWLVEETFTLTDLTDFGCELACLIMPPKHTATPNWGQLSHATWQQRVQALAQVKGIKIV